MSRGFNYADAAAMVIKLRWVSFVMASRGHF